jgi:BirA family transcriptional regulator, biotin operon repressor / biotin---[acetyl-CoA-carboxylase] ligase
MDIHRILRETFVVELEHHKELGSTNDRAVQRAKQGAGQLPLLVIADNQTAGRGRGGNRWWTGPGSLAFSLLLESASVQNKDNAMLGRQLNCRPNIDGQALNCRPNIEGQALNSRPDKLNLQANTLISLAAGLAVAQTVKPLLPDQEVGICWPNDVIAAGRKMAGILVEVLPGGRTIIGVGINTNNTLAEAPAELLPIAATMLDLTGKQYDHAEIMIALLNILAKHFETLKQSPSQLASQANAICLQRDKPLTLQAGNQTIIGTCRGVAPDGALLLKTAEGLRSFYSGVITGERIIAFTLDAAPHYEG